MTRSTPIPREVAISAVNWQLAIHNGEASEISLNHWLDADPNHRRAWEHIQQVNKRLGLMTNPALRSALLTPQGRQRRKAVKQLSTLLFIGAAGVGAGSTLPWREQLADLRTASGERFDMNAYTAAHKTLPFGSMVEVTNPRTGKSVIVRINDRGPFTPGRTIDLSRAAAEEIGLVRRGHGSVELALLD